MDLLKASRPGSVGAAGVTAVKVRPVYFWVLDVLSSDFTTQNEQNPHRTQTEVPSAAESPVSSKRSCRNRTGTISLALMRTGSN